jgi:hypothetical protein
MKSYSHRTHTWNLLTALAIVLAPQAHAVKVFTDDFNTGASPLWGNGTGNWVGGSGVYNAQNPFAANYTSLPFTLTDFVVDVDHCIEFRWMDNMGE